MSQSLRNEGDSSSGLSSFEPSSRKTSENLPYTPVPRTQVRGRGRERGRGQPHQRGSGGRGNISKPEPSQRQRGRNYTYNEAKEIYNFVRNSSDANARFLLIGTTNISDAVAGELVNHLVAQGYSERPIGPLKSQLERWKHNYRTIRSHCERSGIGAETARSTVDSEIERLIGNNRLIPNMMKYFYWDILDLEKDYPSEPVPQIGRISGSASRDTNEEVIGEREAIAEGTPENHMDTELHSDDDDLDDDDPPVPSTRRNVGDIRSSPSDVYPEDGEIGCAPVRATEHMYHNRARRNNVNPESQTAGDQDFNNDPACHFRTRNNNPSVRRTAPRYTNPVTTVLNNLSQSREEGNRVQSERNDLYSRYIASKISLNTKIEEKVTAEKEQAEEEREIRRRILMSEAEEKEANNERSKIAWEVAKISLERKKREEDICKRLHEFIQQEITNGNTGNATQLFSRLVSMGRTNSGGESESN
ncbi:hypothetical protein TRICI_003970 [Trichomonascus ciferrii]|uniref:Uncharacterized protein n=1 Tax=Trichomonascus ciferrii TaxID=44093 RepID=A0A642V271_9ASCO|nr:hypothetical protein TRICI_003970 [Trichomonascus ciferrii]